MYKGPPTTYTPCSLYPSFRLPYHSLQRIKKVPSKHFPIITDFGGRNILAMTELFSKKSACWRDVFRQKDTDIQYSPPKV